MNQEIIRKMVREHGVPGFIANLEAVLSGYALPNGAVIKVDPREFSFKGMWEALVGSMRETFDNALWSRESGALDPTGFPTATEKLLSNVMIKGYSMKPGIADTLVPQKETPATLTARIPGFTTMDTSSGVLTGEEYPTVGFGDKWVGFEEALHQKKEGYEVRITEEVVRFDQTSGIMRMAQNIGQTLFDERERRTVRGVLGIGKDTGTTLNGVYYPSGTDTALYRATEYNLRTNATPIVGSDSVLNDYTDLNEALTVHAQNVRDDRQKGDPRPIVWDPNVLLLPVALTVKASNILASTGGVYITNLGTSSTPEIRTDHPNPVNMMFSGSVPRPVASPYVDEVSSTQWVIYDNQRTFVRMEVFPFQTFRSPAGYMWNRDIIMAMRAREWSRIIALDHRTAQKSTGA